MLESLLNFNDLSERPYLMFLWALIMSSIAIIVSTQVAFQIPIGTSAFHLGGLFALLFTIIPSTYFITVLIKREESLEEKDFAKKNNTSMWNRHERDIIIMLFYFAGVTLAFALWSMVLSDGFFQIQDVKINDVRSFSGTITGEAVNDVNRFGIILRNNLQVMIFAFLFAFIFGAGAVFILAWNASILGVFIGQLSKQLWEVPMVGLSFLPHGIPEIGGYIAAALSGGLISAAVIRKSDSRVLKLVIFDAMKILGLAVMLVFLGAGIEAFF